MIVDVPGDVWVAVRVATLPLCAGIRSQPSGILKLKSPTCVSGCKLVWAINAGTQTSRATIHLSHLSSNSVLFGAQAPVLPCANVFAAGLGTARYPNAREAKIVEFIVRSPQGFNAPLSWQGTLSAFLSINTRGSECRLAHAAII